MAQVVGDVADALAKGLRHCLVLTQWLGHLDRLAGMLGELGHDPVVFRGGMGAKARAAALARLEPDPAGRPSRSLPPLIARCLQRPALDTLFLAAPLAFKGRLVQYAGRILRTYPGKATAEIHDYHDQDTPVLAASLAKRAPGYTSLGFPDPRRLLLTRSAVSASVTAAVSQDLHCTHERAARGVAQASRGILPRNPKCRWFSMTCAGISARSESESGRRRGSVPGEGYL